jgi:WD40 repeat protein
MRLRRSERIALGALTAALGALLVPGGGTNAGRLLQAQLETVESEPSYRWVSFGHAEGHLALRDSPSGAFSPDSSQLAVANGDKVLLQSLGGSGAASVLHPRVALVKDFEIRSASFLAPTRLLILGNGLVETKKGLPPRTPELAFQWDTATDKLSGKVNSLGAEGGTGPAHYFPDMRYVGMAKGNTVDLWNPLDGRGGRVTISPLTQPANLYTFSPDGHWLLLAQIATSSQPNPVVVRLSEHQFVDSLPGHQGAVLSMEFSRDNKKVVTACEDGKVRVFSVPDLPAGQAGWKLLQTLEGHSGPVHRVEFSADGKWLVSGGEDQTVRVWSADNGKLLQMLEEPREPVLSVAFSPDGRFIAASTEKTVLIWQRQP